MKKLFILFILLLLLGGTAVMFKGKTSESGVAFRTVPLKRGDLLVTISATGTIEPEEVINVGAQVAGRIVAFGKDPSGKPIDYGSIVEENTILALIDDSLYKADVDSASAQIDQAKANVHRAEADLAQMKAKLYQAEQNWKRAQELGTSGALSATDYDSYKAEYETAKATVGVGEATVVQAQTSVAQAEAAMVRVTSNLGYCTIRSPVKGVIIDRRVNIGQTVVASLNAPSLFLIAQDLTKMEIWVAVNEADIGQIHPGQKVRFTVDAFPGENFIGEVHKVRLNASMTQNVVTYTVEVTADNSSGRLLPYLTANVQFEINHRSNVLLVPNAALRFTPTAEQVSPEAKAASNKQSYEASTQAINSAPEQEDVKFRLLWLVDGAYVRPLVVRVGLTDGTMTEVEGQGLTEGLHVVTGQQTLAEAQAEAQTQSQSDEVSNPFLPKPPNKGKGGPPPPF